jgi:hypothetical protein
MCEKYGEKSHNGSANKMELMLKIELAETMTKAELAALAELAESSGKRVEEIVAAAIKRLLESKEVAS